MWPQSGTVARMAYLVRLHRPPTTSVIYSAAGKMDQPAIVASDDGVKWVAAWHPTLLTAGTSSGLMERNQRTGRWGNITGSSAARAVNGLDEKTKALLKWATKAVSQKTPAASTGASTKATDIRTVHSPVVGDIRIDGFRAVERKTSHSFDAISKMLLRTVVECHRAWAWKATGLVVTFHASTRAMGMAYSPGAGDRRISLSFSMLEKYDLDSVERTTLHELCHHAREEMHPRQRSRGARGAAEAHDAKFCSMLEKVDPTVAANPRSCRFFTDAADPAVVAETAKAKGVVFSAAAGTLVVDLRSTARASRWAWKWEPNQRGRWPSRFVQLSTSELVAFLLQFPSGERDMIRCVYEGSPVGIHEMIAGIDRRAHGFKRMMDKAFTSTPPSAPPAPAAAFAPPPVKPARPPGGVLLIRSARDGAPVVAWDATGATPESALSWAPFSVTNLRQFILSRPWGERRYTPVEFHSVQMPMERLVMIFSGAARSALEEAFK